MNRVSSHGLKRASSPVLSNPTRRESSGAARRRNQGGLGELPEAVTTCNKRSGLTLVRWNQS